MSTESSASEPNVTFVGGHAVSQQESLGSSLEPDEYEAAKAAVRKAIQEAGESSAKAAKEGKAKDPWKPPGARSEDKEPTPDVDPEEDADTPERGPDGKFLPKGQQGTKKAEQAVEDASDAEEEKVPDPAKATVKELLKAREKVAALKREAKDEKSAALAEIENARKEFQREVEAHRQQQAELARQMKAWQSIKNDPARAVRELGLDPEEFIMNLASEGTPEGAQRRKQTEVDAALAEIREWKAQQVRQQQEYQRQYQEAQIAQHRQNVVKDFLSEAKKDSYPHVAAFYEGQDRALVAYGDIVAQEFRALSGGREASFPEILEFIEDQLAAKASKMYTKSQSKQSQQVRDEATPAQRPKSKGKSLSPNASGERGSLKAKDLEDLDDDERKEAAKQAVKIAMAQ